jgi:soluble lytic murein transglycosylase-like protein
VNGHYFQLLMLALLIGGSGHVRADVLEIDNNGSVKVLSTDSRPESSSPATVGALSQYEGAVKEIALRTGLNPILLEALIWEESRWDMKAVSPKGAIGLAQLMPKTAQELGVDPNNPIANLSAGARYLKMQLDRFGDLELALAAYCAGPEKVIAAGGVPAIPEVHSYIDAIIARIASSHSAL